MKKLLLSIVCAFTLFALNAQIISEDFSTFTVGGKLAQQAQAQGKEYWTTWSNQPGGTEDGVIDEMPAGNKCGKFVGTAAQNIDQILRLGTKNGSVWDPRTTGKWELTFKIYIPTGKDGYFNIKSVFPSTVSETWAMQVYMGTDEGQAPSPGPSTPGVGKIYGGSETGVTFNFAHDTWVPIKIFIDLDNDVAEFYVNGTMIHTYTYSLGSFGLSNHRYIAAFNMFPPNYAATSLFYVDDVVFADVSGGPEVLHQNNFDDKPAGAYVAQSYPDWWTTWDNKPGTSEDALISNEQAQSPNNSAKCSWGTDLVFKAGDKTSGAYTIDFDMYIPTGGRAFFNLLHVFAGGGSEWAVGVYFNTTGSVTGTQIQQNGQLTPFTFPYATWFPVHLDIDLDNDEAKIKINNVDLLTWQFSLKESGGPGERKLAAVDFYPTQAGVNFYFDNFVYAKKGVVSYVEINVTPDKIEKIIVPGGTATQTIKVENTGTSMGEYNAWIELEFEPETGTDNYTLTYSSDFEGGGIGYNNGPHTVEVAAKYPLDFYCDKAGTYINKISYYMRDFSVDNKLTARVYGGGRYNKPGEILYQSTMNNPIIEGWNEFTLAEPILLGGQDIWVAFEFQQPVGGYLMSYDDSGSTAENSAWERLNGGSWSQLTQVGQPPQPFEGKWMIKAFSKGKVIKGCWISLDGTTYGNVPKGTSKTFDVNFNAAGLAIGTYKANLFVNTNNPDPALFTIPCTITVGSSSWITVDPTSIVETAKDTLPKSIPIKIKNVGNIKGSYTVKESTAQWLTFAGNIAGDLNPNEEDTFDVILCAEGLENNKTYEADIEISVSDEGTDKIVIPCKLIVSIPVGPGVGEYSVKTLVFPNPATNNITVISTQNINSVQIINFVGQTVYSSVVNKEQTTINTSNLTPGIYFIRVNTEAGAQNVKLIIK